MEEKKKQAEWSKPDGGAEIDERAGLDGCAGLDRCAEPDGDAEIDGRAGLDGRAELDRQLEAFERSSAYTTCSLLKESGVERTELVERDGRRYVRKYLNLSIVGDRAHPYERLEGVAAPFIANVIETHRIADKLVVVTEYIPGETLAALVKRKGALSTQEAKDYVACLGRALGFLHDRPDGAIVHRDVNPSNIIVSSGQAWLIDLGIARTHTDGVKRDTTMLGTTGFAAPEQYGFRQTDERTDVFALGKVLTFMLTEDGNFPEALDAHTACVVARATALDPDARYASVDEMLADWTCDESAARDAGDACDNEDGVTGGNNGGNATGDDNGDLAKPMGKQAKRHTEARSVPWRHNLWNIWQVVSGLGVVLMCAYVVYGFTNGTNAGRAVSDVCILVFLLVIPWAATTNLPGVLDRIPWLDERRHFKQFVIVACSLTALVVSAGFWPAGP